MSASSSPSSPASPAPSTPSADPPGEPGGGRGAGPLRGVIGALAGDIKLAHSVFALPFALLGAMLAWEASGRGLGWSLAGLLGLVVVCMVLARTWAMLFNRLADRRIDAANPRTRGRALASGRVSVRAGWSAAGIAAVGFVAATGGFWAAFGNPWPQLLSVPVLAWIAFYSLTKRFTALCHVFLGGALAISPIAAAIAVHPASLGSTPALWLIAGMVLAWVAGFDIIYALQDADFDRASGLRSIPAALGSGRALWISRSLHAAAVVLLLAAWAVDRRLGVFFLLGIVAVAVLLAAEHAILVRNDTARTGKGLDMAFFTLNGIVSCVLGLAGVVDLLRT